jgi:hypothetical protein
MGFGDYQTAAAANLVDAAVFLYLDKNIDNRIMNWVYSNK